METARPAFRSRVWPTAALVVGGLGCALAVLGFPDPNTTRIVAAVSVAIVAAVLGLAAVKVRRQRREYEDELAHWAAERAGQAERLRIARELHDVVSHGLGLITVRAAAAQAVRSSDEMATALADIERSSRQATDELRRMLAVLRSPDPAPLRPADTLADLPAIVQAATDAGLNASLRLDGLPFDELSDVPPGVQLTICAVVREALHNTVRHAGPTQAEVVVRSDSTGFTVEVLDRGGPAAGQPPSSTGHGLAGLRERLAGYGGTLDAGPAAGGYRVTARIPLREGP